MPHTHLTVFVSTEATLIVTFNIYTDSLSPSSVAIKDDTTNPAHALVISEKCICIFEHALTYYINSHSWLILECFQIQLPYACYN